MKNIPDMFAESLEDEEIQDAACARLTNNKKCTKYIVILIRKIFATPEMTCRCGQAGLVKKTCCTELPKMLLVHTTKTSSRCA